MAFALNPEEDFPSLAASISTTIQNITPTSQLHLRLQILASWFNSSLSLARAALSSNRDVLELGCGQGDMTATLASLLPSASHTKILAVDPAALDYGSPITLGEAQATISKGELGGKIDWIQAESLDFIAQLKKERKVPGHVILALSLFYLPSENYLLDLLTALKDLSASSEKAERNGMKLLLAEWGMRATHPSAEPHIQAVQTQLQQKIPDGNIRTLFYPEVLKRIALEAGWKLESENWIVPEEDVDDGCWEVATANVREKEGWRDEKKELKEMEQAAAKSVRSMDVWGGAFGC